MFAAPEIWPKVRKIEIIAPKSNSTELSAVICALRGPLNADFMNFQLKISE